MPPFFQTLPLITAVFMAVGALPKAGAKIYTPSTQTLQVRCSHLKDALLVTGALGQQDADYGARKSSTPATQQPTLAPNPNPPFLRHPVLFDRNSVEVNAVGNERLQRAATWLKAHADSRVLIVGSCDTSGSESCTHTLAEARGAVVRKFLENCGVSPNQVVGVKGWNNPDHDCRPRDAKCQQLSRSTELFLAASAAPLKE